MTPEQLDALPIGSVIDVMNNCKAKGADGRWYGNCASGDPSHLVRLSEESGVELSVITPPEPDHSMCARLAKDERHTYPWVLFSPNGSAIGRYGRAAAQNAGFAVPDPEPTVVERVAEVLGERWPGTAGHALDGAQALADAGLLKDNKQTYEEVSGG